MSPLKVLFQKSREIRLFLFFMEQIIRVKIDYFYAAG